VDRRSGLALLAALAAALPGVTQDPARAALPGVVLSEAEIARALALSPLGPPPADPTNRVADDPAARALGERLFSDVRLSRDGTVACATCHDPERAFTDGRTVTKGLAEGRRNAPSLFNSAWSRWLMWDGSADSLWAQALRPIESPSEMGASRRAALELVRGDEELRRAYEGLFGPLPEPGAEPLAADGAFANLGKALAAYERTLVLPPAAFDVFVEGLRDGDAAKIAALGEREQRGLQLFLGKAGCRSCHTGPLFSDREFHDTEVPPLGGGELADAGRHAGAQRVLEDPFNARGLFSDERSGERARNLETLVAPPETWGQFKTPSLRGVAHTAPYMHQGQLATLAEVVRFYVTREGARGAGHHREKLLRPLDLSEDEQQALVAFLESL
jgi:cytochrome c peroxidase